MKTKWKRCEVRLPVFINRRRFTLQLNAQMYWYCSSQLRSSRPLARWVYLEKRTACSIQAGAVSLLVFTSILTLLPCAWEIWDPVCPRSGVTKSQSHIISRHVNAERRPAATLSSRGKVEEGNYTQNPSNTTTNLGHPQLCWHSRRPVLMKARWDNNVHATPSPFTGDTLPRATVRWHSRNTIRSSDRKATSGRFMFINPPYHHRGADDTLHDVGFVCQCGPIATALTVDDCHQY